MEELKANFTVIYDQYIERIYRFVYLKVASQEIAEDLSSEVFTRTWTQYVKSSDKIENIQAFIYQIARNVIVDYYRKTGKVRVVSVEESSIEIIDEEYSIEEQAHTNLEIAKIKAAIHMLPGDQQDLLIFRYIDELSVPEIAQITGKSEENVRVGVHRALKALREHIVPEAIEPQIALEKEV